MMKDDKNIPSIGESDAAKKLRELEARIERLPAEERDEFERCVRMVDHVLAQYQHNARILAVLYIGNALAARFREAQAEEIAEKQKNVH